MNTVKLLIASSAELKEDRSQFRLFISQENKLPMRGPASQRITLTRTVTNSGFWYNPSPGLILATRAGYLLPWIINNR